MPADTRLTASDLVPHIALASHRFPDWEAPSDIERGFGPGEIVAFLAGVAAALASIDGTLASTEAILGRLERLYRWVRGKPAQSQKTAPTTERERILILLFDAYATERGGTTSAQLAARSAVAPDALSRHLAALERMHLVDAFPDDVWCYRVE